MGSFATTSGMSRELFRARQRLPSDICAGAWAIATIAACGGFCGDLRLVGLRPAATFLPAVAYPEMRRYGYPQSFATRASHRGPAAHWAS